MRDRLIELMREAEDKVQKTLKEKYSLDLTEWLGIYADHLLENGVIVPPCKVGDIAWEINTENPFEEDLRVIETKVEGFFVGTSIDIHSMDSFGKTVYLTEEEAVQALKEREG